VGMTVERIDGTEVAGLPMLDIHAMLERQRPICVVFGA
jgi:hypothetical protein